MSIGRLYGDTPVAGALEDVWKTNCIWRSGDKRGDDEDVEETMIEVPGGTPEEHCMSDDRHGR
jgi:hypothetical protein